MDPTSTVRTDALPAIATLVIPGAIATAPFVWLILDSHDALSGYFSSHDGVSTLVAVLVAMAAGLLVESLGSYVEVYLIDQRRADRDRRLVIWWRYLRIAWEHEPIGQRYLRRLLVTFKFELNMSLAVFFSTIGVILLVGAGLVECRAGLWIVLGGGVATVVLFCLASSSADVLAKVREELVSGVGKPPFDGNGNPSNDQSA